MLREIVKIDRELCTGCGECVPNCHEGALQIIDGKAVLISDLMCDGLGACIGHCPEGAIEIEKREAVPYNETEVIAQMVTKGRNTVVAHLKHLKDHNETGFLKEGVQFLKANEGAIKFDVNSVISEVHNSGAQQHAGCPGSKEMSFKPVAPVAAMKVSGQSELTQWPVQMHLVNPKASYFQGSDLLVAADCVAFTVGNFHSEHLKGKSLAIGCPKLDSNQEIYLNKLVSLIDESKINTITLMIMEVPCCGGMQNLVQRALDMAQRKVPVKRQVVSVKGEILLDEWM